VHVAVVIHSLHRRHCAAEFRKFLVRIENWNQNPRPFTWTKTAEEILDSLPRYIARTSGAAH
jgi:hypothetical protein